MMRWIRTLRNVRPPSSSSSTALSSELKKKVTTRAVKILHLLSLKVESVYSFTGGFTYLPANMVSALVVISSMSGSEAGVKSSIVEQLHKRMFLKKCNYV